MILRGKKVKDNKTTTKKLKDYFKMKKILKKDPKRHRKAKKRHFFK